MPQPPKPQSFGERVAQERRLKGVREHRDIDQKTVAKALKVTSGTVSRWESGESIAKDAMLRRLAAYFGVAPGWLRYGEGSREIEPSVAGEEKPPKKPDRFVSKGAARSGAGQKEA